MKKRFNIKILILVLCFMFMLCLSSCSNPYLSDKGAGKTFIIPSAPTPIVNLNNPDDAKGTVTLGLFAYDTLNPLLTQNKSIQKYMTLVYDSLIVFDIECKPVPSVAESWQTTDGGLTWKIKIKDNINFHDGSQLTVYDIKNTLDWIKSNTCYYSYCAQGVVSYNIISQFEIDIVLGNVDALFPHKLNFPIIKSEDLNQKLTVPNGTGMYKYISGDNNIFSFEINKEYFGNCPKIKNVNIKIFNSSLELNQSDVDVILNFGDNVIKYAKKDNYTVSQYKDDVVCCMIPSAKTEPGVRKFINSNIDRELIIRAFAADCASVTNSILPEDAYFMRGYNNASKTDGVIKPNNLKLIVCKEDEDLIRLSNVIYYQFNNMKIDCEISILEANEFYVALSEGEYDFAFLNYNMKCIPDLEAMFATNGALNYNTFNDESVTSLMNSIKNAYSDQDISLVVDNDTFISYANDQSIKLALRLNEVLPVISLCRKNASVSLSKNVSCVSLYNFNYWNTLDFASWEMRK